MKSLTLNEWMALTPAEKSARAAAIVASVEWHEDRLYAIGDPVNNEEGVCGYPLYLCTLDEDGVPWLGEVQSLISPTPEHWDSAETIVTSISEIYPQ